jgi:secondary thiamine-phosphate synthase enzyme
MHTFAAVSPTYRHALLKIRTERPTEFVDITDRLQELVDETGVRTGLINVQTLHTTTAIVVNEHEPLLLTDFAALFERVAPSAAGYRHDDPALRTVNLTADERVNGHAHCRALLLAPFACLNLEGGAIRLGRWQRVFFVELDGARERDLSVVIAGESMR